MRMSIPLVFFCCFALPGLGKAPDNLSLDPGQGMGQRARPSASSESAERKAPEEDRARKQAPAPGDGANAVRESTSGSGFRTSPRPEALDSLVLLVSKTFASGNWQLELDWSGAASPYTISYSTDPSFQTGAQTLALDYTGTSYGQPATAGSALECFEVTDASVVSLAAQTLGYQPIPPPVTPQFVAQDYWWGEPLTLDSGYLDPIDKENLVHFFDRPVRPDSVSGVSGSFASSLTVDHIPDDSRGFWVVAEARGNGSSYPDAPFLNLYAKNISLTGITSLTWAPCEGSPDKGSVWVAASGGIWEVDLFRRIPVLTPQDTGTKMYLSRPTNMTTPAATHQILYVDGINGVTEVKQIDACTGAITTFALTSDSQFTSAILPRGIAVDPSGTYCYIADANRGGRIVRIPAGNSGNITDYWGNRTFGFNDPTGMDAGLNGRLWLTESNGRLWQIISQSYPYPMGWVDAGANCLDIDKDVSTSGNTIFVWDTTPFTDAYNRNGIEDVAGTPTRYHGGTVFGQTDGKLRLDPVWLYSFSRHFPQRVLLRTQGQNILYASPYQYTDRIIEIQVRGWPGLPTQLRVIDPPDFAAYAQDGGWCGSTGFPACTALPPYEGNDNLAMTDYGLTTDPSGAGAATTLKVYPASNYYAIAYLKVPPNVSGNNFQVEATKCKADGTVLDKKVLSLSPVFTTWKRVYIERDKMFRKGGLLFTGYGVSGDCGGSGQPPCCGTMGQLPCNQMEVYDWTNANLWDTIVVFDERNTAEGGGEIKVITGIVDNYNGRKVITLDSAMTQSYYGSDDDGASPPQPTFANAHSAGYGVLSNCDCSSNQLNASNSCFYDADMRDIQQPFNDGFAEIIGLANGMGAVPYIPESIPFYDTNPSPPGPEDNNRLNFHLVWFKNNTYQNDCFQLIGCKGRDFSYPSTKAGDTSAANKFSYIFTHTMESAGQYFNYDALTIQQGIQGNTDHEIGHEFNLNRCSNPLSCDPPPPPPDPVPHIGPHDYRSWWGATTTDCPNSNPCMMDPNGGNIWDKRNRLCKEDLLLGDPNCTGSNKDNSAVRTLADPLP